MAGYIGSKSSVTLVDGYTEAEADAEFVNDPNGTITVSGSNVGIGTSSPDTELNIGFLGADDTNTIRVEGSNGASERYAFDIEADGENAKTNFKIGVGGGAPTTRMTIDLAGRITMPYQPAFYWTKTTSQVATSSNEVVVWDSSKVNTGNHFNNQRFTAPVAGVYLFQMFTLSDGNALTNDVHIRKNGSTLFSRQRNANSNAHETTASSCIISLAVNDYVEAVIGGSGDIVYGDGGDAWSGFGGHLIG